MHSDWYYVERDEDVDLDCVPPQRGQRVRQERVRLGFDQKSFAEKVGVGLHRIRSIEKGGNREIQAHELQMMASAGTDIVYVLTAQKAPVLKPDESALVDNYRNATPSGQASLREVGSAFAQQGEALKKADGES